MTKYKIGMIILLLLCLCSFSFVRAEGKPKALKNKVIYLDPGHGGADPGALYKKIEEQEINLKIAQKLKQKLEETGATVYLTRDGDYDLSVPYAINRKRSDLSRRANIINRSNCDMYLSIHLNAETSSSWHGAEAYYDDIHSENEKIAKIMQEEFQKNLGSKRNYKKTDTMYLHKRVKRPGVLLEVGFLSNPNDRYLLTQATYQDKVAFTIMNGIIRYFT